VWAAWIIFIFTEFAHDADAAGPHFKENWLEKCRVGPEKEEL
jgi:hypothetical protein